MMTTMAALLGGVPLALGSGMGSELRHPLGITIGWWPACQPAAHSLHHPGDHLWFDRLASRFGRGQKKVAADNPQLVAAD